MNITDLIAMCGLALHNFETYSGTIRFSGVDEHDKVVFRQIDDHVLVIIFGWFCIREVFFVYDDSELVNLRNAINEVIK